MNHYVDRIAGGIDRALSKLNRSWTKRRFDGSIYGLTKTRHEQVIADAELALQNKDACESGQAYASSQDPLVQQGWQLKKQAEQTFRDLYAGKSIERIMIQVPDPVYSPAGYSLFTNLADSLNFIGIPTCILGWNEAIGDALENFQPSVLLSSDHATYLARIDWDAVARYKQAQQLKVGLTASLEEYDNTPLAERLDWARKHGVDFYYSFRDDAYVSGRQEYGPFYQSGYKILSIPFGANIMHYYPVGGFARDIDFVLIASKKKEHTQFMQDIVRKNYGFIDGPGWKHAPHFKFNRDRDRFIYARAKAGLNVHLPEQIDWACEVNERTYQLAACGVPQIIDHPKLLDKLFSKDAMFVADNPKQYTDLFRMVMSQPQVGQERALLAQREAFGQHTTFHRAESFVQQLSALA